MLFNSWAYALYLPLVWVIYIALRRQRAQNWFLLAASYFFYGCWDWRFSALMAFSTIVDYIVAVKMAQAGMPAPASSGSRASALAGSTYRDVPQEPPTVISPEAQRRRKMLLLVSLVTNLAILGFFKYFNFFADSFVDLAKVFGLTVHPFVLRIILPVGVSFYTFQAMAYTIDVYRGDHPPAKSFLDFALYVCFFPHLVAGPIQRYMLLEQIERPRTVTWQHISSGCVLILVGLVRKVAIADHIAPLVDRMFTNPAGATSGELLVGLYLFSIQIYCDFAGYTDIARGSSRLLGIELMLNFQHPYFSTSITEFWRRWHISLSNWLRDYLYIPLGGNRHGEAKTYRNLMLTMLLGGLWHGANWTFVVWGGLQGLYLAGHKLILGNRKPAIDNRPRTLAQWPGELAKMVFTFHLMALSWIFFRSVDFHHAWQYASGILALQGPLPMFEIKKLVLVLALLLFIDIPQYRRNNHTVMLEWPILIRGLSYAGLVLTMFALRSDGNVPFIYFQF